MVVNPLELDSRWFEILAQTAMITLSKHRISGSFDIWIFDHWSRVFVDPSNGYRSEPTEQQAWAQYMRLIT